MEWPNDGESDELVVSIAMAMRRLDYGKSGSTMRVVAERHVPCGSVTISRNGRRRGRADDVGACAALGTG